MYSEKQWTHEYTEFTTAGFFAIRRTNSFIQVYGLIKIEQTLMNISNRDGQNNG